MTNKETAKWFLPALGIKCFGAIALGLIYQFYYPGGDTFNFWTNGSAHIWEAFMDSPLTGLNLIFGDLSDPQYYQYYSQIWLRDSESSLFIIKLAALFDILTFHTYSATALFFAVLSLIGSWSLFIALKKVSRIKTATIFTVMFLIPSVVIWGSGILKDSITISALFLAIACLINLIELRIRSIFHFLILALCLYVIFIVKVYVLVSFVPIIFLWMYLKNISKISSWAVKTLVAPALLAFFGFIAFYSATLAGASSDRYNLESIPKWSKITAYDLSQGWGKDAGSTYVLGELDGTWDTMLSYTPAAINVSLFRPYIWESSNLLMVMTAIESFFLLILTLSFIRRLILGRSQIDRISLLLILFSLSFAFAIGVSTFNFGALARYRIPILPLYCIGILLSYYSNKKTKKQIIHA